MKNSGYVCVTSFAMATYSSTMATDTSRDGAKIMVTPHVSGRWAAKNSSDLFEHACHLYLGQGTASPVGHGTDIRGQDSPDLKVLQPRGFREIYN